MNIVIRSPNWIGDCVMSLPAIRALKFYLPNARIFVITKAYLKDFFQGIKEIDEIVSIADGAGFKDFISSAIRLNLFRHQILTYLTSKGIVDAKIQLMSGHKSRESLSIYQDLSLADVEEEYFKVMKDFPIQ